MNGSQLKGKCCSCFSFYKVIIIGRLLKASHRVLWGFFSSIIDREFFLMTNILVSVVCLSLLVASYFILYFNSSIICESNLFFHVKEGKIINNTSTFFSIEV